MNLGEKLYNLRKNKNLSQEEVADKLNVTRQSVSKWETGESKPDIDKIIPICELFDISTNELLGIEDSNRDVIEDNSETFNNEIKKKRALFLSSGIFLYFLAVVCVIFCEESGIGETLGISLFLLICGIATCLIVYQALVYSKSKKENEIEKKKNKELELIDGIIASIFTCLYLIISFTTGMWHITWIIWIIFSVVINIVEIIYELRVNKNGK